MPIILFLHLLILLEEHETRQLEQVLDVGFGRRVIGAVFAVPSSGKDGFLVCLLVGCGPIILCLLVLQYFDGQGIENGIGNNGQGGGVNVRFVAPCHGAQKVNQAGAHVHVHARAVSVGQDDAKVVIFIVRSVVVVVVVVGRKRRSIGLLLYLLVVTIPHHQLVRIERGFRGGIEVLTMNEAFVHVQHDNQIGIVIRVGRGRQRVVG